MGEEIEFENGLKWSNFRLSWAHDLDLDLGSGHGHYLFSSLIEYYLYTKFHRNQRNFLWTDGRTDRRTDGNLPPIVLGRLPKFGSRPKRWMLWPMTAVKLSAPQSAPDSTIATPFCVAHMRRHLINFSVFKIIWRGSRHADTGPLLSTPCTYP